MKERWNEKRVISLAFDTSESIGEKNTLVFLFFFFCKFPSSSDFFFFGVYTLHGSFVSFAIISHKPPHGLGNERALRATF